MKFALLIVLIALVLSKYQRVPVEERKYHRYPLFEMPKKPARRAPSAETPAAHKKRVDRERVDRVKNAMRSGDRREWGFPWGIEDPHCPMEFYDEGGQDMEPYCDCECGDWDPDCDNPELLEYMNTCPPGMYCNKTYVDGTPEPICLFIDEYHEDEADWFDWEQPILNTDWLLGEGITDIEELPEFCQAYFHDGIGFMEWCTCGCGFWDPSCDDHWLPVVGCDDIPDTFYMCKFEGEFEDPPVDPPVGVCVEDVPPEAPDGWDSDKCFDWFDDFICDCECGAPDPDCELFDEDGYPLSDFPFGCDEGDLPRCVDGMCVYDGEMWDETDPDEEFFDHVPGECFSIFEQGKEEDMYFGNYHFVFSADICILEDYSVHITGFMFNAMDMWVPEFAIEVFEVTGDLFMMDEEGDLRRRARTHPKRREDPPPEPPEPDEGEEGEDYGEEEYFMNYTPLFSFWFGIYKIIEYNTAGEVSLGYTPGEDEIVAEYYMWDKIADETLFEEVETPEDEYGWCDVFFIPQLPAYYPQIKIDFVYSMVEFVDDEVDPEGDHTLTLQPNEVKINIEVTNLLPIDPETPGGFALGTFVFSSVDDWEVHNPDEEVLDPCEETMHSDEPCEDLGMVDMGGHDGGYLSWVTYVQIPPYGETDILDIHMTEELGFERDQRDTWGEEEDEGGEGGESEEGSSDEGFDPDEPYEGGPENERTVWWSIEGKPESFVWDPTLAAGIALGQTGSALDLSEDSSDSWSISALLF